MKDITNQASYDLAEKIIAEVLATGAKECDLSDLRIEELPESIKQLTQLEVLSLRGCKWLKNILALEALTELKQLDLSRCRSLRDVSVVSHLSGLQQLDLSGCENLKDVSVLSHLSSLQQLSLSWCSNLKDVSVVSHLLGLEQLSLSWCSNLKDVSVVSHLLGLQQLSLSGCSNLKDVSGLSNLSGLQQLSLSGCSSLKDVSVLSHLSGLQQLSLSGRESLRDLSGLSHLSGLQQLDLSWCENLKDVSVLSNLSGLQQLNLSWCRSLKDVSGLSNLSGLQQLDLSMCSNLRDVSGLSHLSNLQQLDLSGCRSLKDVSVVSHLSGLQQLDLSGCRSLKDVSVLSHLSGLQQLSLSGCSSLNDVSVLSHLLGLQQLSLRRCSSLKDVSVLSHLSGLQQLSLSGCSSLKDVSGLSHLSGLQQLSLSGCSSLKDVSVLSHLSGLQQLSLSGRESLRDLSGLSHLSGLQQLDLSWCENLKDVSVLSHLSGLQQLNLSWCENLKDVSGLSNLLGLQQLDLSGCSSLNDVSGLSNLLGLQQLDLSGCDKLVDVECLNNLNELRELKCHSLLCIYSSLLFKLPRLHIYQGGCIDTPEEITNPINHHNSFPKIIAWQKDILASGEAPNNELKLLILGNGRIGKTQIARKLQQQPFDPAIESTHGIMLGHFEVLPEEDDKPAVYANLWDFGGQDIYLGTHGLFLDEKAIYVIVWHPDYENNNEYIENGVPMCNRSLAYWLEYVQSLAGKDAPIIVVQSQCDKESQVIPPLLPSNHGFTRLKVSSCSAKVSYGLERLQPELKSAARLLCERYEEVKLPKNWLSVMHELQHKRDNESCKTISYDEFEALCQNNGSQYSSIVASYLHRTGQVFWRDGAFGNDLVLDQAWALKGLYALLDRTKTLPIIQRELGQFHLWHLKQTVWSQYTEQEQKLFIDMMKQCGSCFSLGENTDTYIAPDLLPSEWSQRESVQDVWRNAQPTAKVELKYHFLHDGIIKAVLCAIGEKAGRAGIYWRTGVCYFDREISGAVKIHAIYADTQRTSQQGSIWIEIEGSKSQQLITHLVESVLSIRIGKKPETIWHIGAEKKDSSEHEHLAERSQESSKPFDAIKPDQNLGDRAKPLEISCVDRRKTNNQNILVIATEWSSHHGGLSTFNRELCIALAEIGKTVHCVVKAAEPKERAEAKAKNIELIVAKNGDLSRKLPLDASYQPDIIIGHGRVTGSDAKAQQEDHFTNAKRIHFIHTAAGQLEWFKDKPDAAQQAEAREKEEKELAVGASLVAAVGPRLYDEFQNVLDGLKPERRPAIFEFQVGFNREESRSTTWPTLLHCLILGRAEDAKIKGIDIAAKAIHVLDKTDLRAAPELIIRGAPSGEGTKLQTNLTTTYPNLSLRVREFSADLEDIASDIRRASLVIMPSRTEGFGLVALEALRFGTPILVSNNSGFARTLKKILKDDLEANRYIVETPDSLDEAANNWGKKIARELYDVPASINRTKELIEKLSETLIWSKSCQDMLDELERVSQVSK
ncbi:leucine-rich repeat protein [Agitococcus lubricus]|uniref:Glycosyltransferase involved in cell wall biosynthesis n=1 Tax=Agitococcus lubricus TaxID=1077255 RepID=A0A2T5ISC9_9GAMM|nr:leucine-rich repeat protein [Agitococcus lubricus]PTQ86726.1 glycosyltransferase involved in cell wall biosynthesis [Agitococcus lubricus]